MTNKILVTGASNMYGQEVVASLARRGLHVFAGVRPGNSHESQGNATAKPGGSVQYIPLDVTNQEQVDEAVRVLLEAPGTLVGVVHADFRLIRGYFEDLSADEIRAVFETNLYGMMRVTRALIPHLRNQRQGRIVIISSVAGRIASPSGSAYAASRFAQEGFAESLMQELAPLGVHVSLIEPGITKAAKTTFDRSLARQAQDPTGPYYAWGNRAEELYLGAMQTSKITVSDVAEAVYLALTTAKPRLRYVVGRRTQLILTVRGYVPAKLFERVYFGELIRRITRS